MENEPKFEDVESEIKELLSQLDNYALDQFPAESQDELEEEWYFAEEQAKVGKDREKALEDLGVFIKRLKNTPKV